MNYKVLLLNIFLKLIKLAAIYVTSSDTAEGRRLLAKNDDLWIHDGSVAGGDWRDCAFGVTKLLILVCCTVELHEW